MTKEIILLHISETVQSGINSFLLQHFWQDEREGYHALPARGHAGGQVQNNTFSENLLRKVCMNYSQERMDIPYTGKTENL